MCRLTPPELEHHWPQMPQVCARRGLASASLAARAQCCGETSNSSACGSLPKARVMSASTRDSPGTGAAGGGSLAAAASSPALSTLGCSGEGFDGKGTHTARRTCFRK